MQVSRKTFLLNIIDNAQATSQDSLTFVMPLEPIAGTTTNKKVAAILRTNIIILANRDVPEIQSTSILSYSIFHLKKFLGEILN